MHYYYKVSPIFLLSFSLIKILITCNKIENIIEILYLPRKSQNISTKHGPITFQIYYDFNTYCNIDGIKDLNLFSFPNYNCTYKLYGENNNSLQIILEHDSPYKLNHLITRLFYETNYINKMIYAIEYNPNNITGLQKRKENLSIFYGGVPNHISKDLIKYTFLPNDKVSEINILYNNGTKINIPTDPVKEENNLIELGRSLEFICFPEYILDKIKNLLLKDYLTTEVDKGFTPKYLTNSEKFKNFPNISFNIRDKIITINKYNLSPNYGHSFYFELLINYIPCDHFKFGYVPFMMNINVREFNLETNETNLFIEKNNNIIMAAKEMKINSGELICLILIFIFISLINIFIFWRKKQRKKNIEEYNNYYEI